MCYYITQTTPLTSMYTDFNFETLGPLKNEKKFAMFLILLNSLTLIVDILDSDVQARTTCNESTLIILL